MSKQAFDLEEFLSSVDGGRRLIEYGEDDTIFAQGDSCDAVFYMRAGRCKITVLSEQGKEAVIAIHGNGDFFGEGCLTGQPLRLATATALVGCCALRAARCGEC